MDEHSLLSYVQDIQHDGIVAIIVELLRDGMALSFGVYIGKRWDRRELNSGVDKRHIAFGTNHISADGVLKLRYIDKEAPIHKLFGNLALRSEFLNALKQVSKVQCTRPGYFLVDFPEQFERKILDTIRNYLSEGMGEKILRNAANPASKEVPFVITVTDEHYDAEPEQMARVILTPLSMLEHLPDAASVGVEEDFQRDRMQTLAYIQERFTGMSDERKRRHIYNLPTGNGTF